MFFASVDTTLSCSRYHHVSVVGNSMQALHKNYAIIATIHSSLNTSSSFDCDFTNEGKENNDDLKDDDNESSRNGSSIELASHLLTAGSADWEGMAGRVLSGGQGQCRHHMAVKKVAIRDDDDMDLVWGQSQLENLQRASM
ncbi:E3 ubiquitin-protein ligase KEG [Camellia lanceoleosa]|uniref:E3 ubiquitin-protein ligase KEG n=1 Tax=Camellia lanceoleosa TaxID=1840588 RepID=A0ACC0II49_9ERIC|nr:E3 ubiquitin-protein ligase KEG [Camellia lanceoleosa]